MEKSEKITLLSSIVIVGFVFAVIYHYVLGSYMGLKYPYNSFLWDPHFVGGDFVLMLHLIKNLTPYGHIDSLANYFPLAYLILYPLSFIKNFFISYFILLVGFLGFFITMNFKSFKCDNLTQVDNFRNIFVFTFISYPLLFLLDRGNFDIILFIFFTAFVYFFKWEKYLLAAIFIAGANACKPFPLFFLVLFLFKKKYKEFFISLILSVLLIIGGFLALNGDFFNQVTVFSLNLFEFKKEYLLSYSQNNYGMYGSSSLFMVLKLLLTRLTATPIIAPAFLVEIYKYLSLFAGGIILFFVAKEKVFWKQISLLTLQMLLLPYLTNDYKLIFLFVPIWLFVNAKIKSKYDLVYTILFGLLLIPKSLTILTPHIGYGYYFSLSMIINSSIMITLIGLIIAEQVRLKHTELLVSDKIIKKDFKNE